MNLIHIVFIITFVGVQGYEAVCNDAWIKPNYEAPKTIYLEKGKQVCSTKGNEFTQIDSELDKDLPSSIYCIRKNSLNQHTQWECFNSDQDQSITGTVSWENHDGKFLDNSFRIVIHQYHLGFAEIFIAVISGLVMSTLGWEFILGVLVASCGSSSSFSSGSKFD